MALQTGIINFEAYGNTDWRMLFRFLRVYSIDTMHLLTILGLFLLLFTACGSDELASADTTTEETAIAAPPPPSIGESPVRYAWVEDLNLRAEPSTKGKVIGKLKTTDKLTLSGEKSSQETPYVLRGALYVEPWYEVETEEGLKGWVFGGAIRQEKERKGNNPLRKLSFNFPYFGQYDLKSWKKTGEEASGGGDFTVTTTTYQGDGQKMEISDGYGEYGYFFKHEVFNLKGDTLKARSVTFDNETLLLTEEIVDYMEANPVTRVRSQASPISYQQLNGMPLLVRGEWKVGGVQEEE